jgi:hypothetical protein
VNTDEVCITSDNNGKVFTTSIACLILLGILNDVIGTSETSKTRPIPLVDVVKTGETFLICIDVTTETSLTDVSDTNAALKVLTISMGFEQIKNDDTTRRKLFNDKFFCKKLVTHSLILT